MRAVGAERPLVILLDTGEVIGDRAWGWLRRVMVDAGPRVVWAVGARFETEAEAGADSPVTRFVRDIGDARLILMSPTRFDDAMIRTYLEGRLAGNSFSDEQIDMVASFTRGLPLAVSLTATLLGQGQQVEDVCRETDHGHPGSVVSGLARRYLVHAERQEYSANDPRRDDVLKILGLALAYGDVRSDPDLLAALWDTEDPLGAFADLARRHDFVLPASRRLHDDVRDTLRIDLLDPYRRVRARPVSQRALALINTRLEQMRSRWPTLDDQLDHVEYTTAVLAALWHAFWEDNQAGLDLLVYILPVLAVAHPAAADAAAAMTGQFEPTFNHGQRRDLDLLTQIEGNPRFDEWMATQRRTTSGTTRRAKISLDGLALQFPGSTTSVPTLGTPTDREVATTILMAALEAENRDDQAAVAALQAAGRTTSVRLRNAISSRADDIARRLIWAGPNSTSVATPLGLEAAELATRMRPDTGLAWNSYATALNKAGRNEEGLAAHDKALALNPRNSFAHSNRGTALRAVGRNEDALAAYDQALALDASNRLAHIGRAIALVALGRNEDALAAYDQTLALDASNAIAHIGRGTALSALGHNEDALAAYDQALRLSPDDASVIHNNRGLALAGLGRNGDALAAYDQALALDAGYASAHVGRGNALRALGRYGDALAAYDQALALDASNRPPHVGRGNALWDLGRYGDALAAYDQALALDASNRPAHVGRGIALRALGRYEEALAAYDQALRLSPDDASGIHNNRGVALAGLGRYEDALAAYDKALALNPDDGMPHENKGIALVALGDY